MDLFLKSKSIFHTKGISLRNFSGNKEMIRTFMRIFPKLKPLETPFSTKTYFLKNAFFLGVDGYEISQEMVKCHKFWGNFLSV
jgi:hypothetical protein